MEKTIAAQIIDAATDWTELVGLAGDNQVDSEEDYENEISICEFKDGSKLKLSGITYNSEIL